MGWMWWHCRRQDGEVTEELIRKTIPCFSGPQTSTGQYGTGFIINSKVK
jgi:hypothetical protein